MIRDFFDGIRAYGRAIHSINHLGLWHYALIPAFISIVLGGGVAYASWQLADDVGHWLVSWYSWEWGSGTIQSVSSWVGGLMVGIGGLLSFKYLILILVAPFMSILSAKVEERLLGPLPKQPFRLSKAISDIMRGIRLSLRNLSRELFLTLVLFIFGFIPVIGWISPFLIFLVQANYAGFGNLDYTLERYFSVRGSVSFVREHRGLAMGNGTVFMLLLMTGIGFMVAPPLATVAGTLEALERLRPDVVPEDALV